MSDYIIGQQIVEEYQIQPFELVNRFIRLGLSPYTPHSGVPVEVSQFLNALFNAQKMDGDTPQSNLWNNYIAANSETKWPDFQFSGDPIIDDEIAKALLNHVYKWALYEKLVGLDQLKRNGPLKPKPAMMEKVKPSIRPSAEHKEICRERAQRIWKAYPTMHPTELVAYPAFQFEIEKKNEDAYTPDILMKWVRDLWPEKYLGPAKELKIPADTINNLLNK